MQFDKYIRILITFAPPTLVLIFQPPLCLFQIIMHQVLLIGTPLQNESLDTLRQLDSFSSSTTTLD